MLKWLNDKSVDCAQLIYLSSEQSISKIIGSCSPTQNKSVPKGKKKKLTE